MVRTSSSPWASPVVLIEKADKTIRFCIDFRRLNAVTLANKYPLPNLQETLDALGGSGYYSTLDLKSGYWQVPVAEEDQAKTAFVTNQGLF